MRQIVAIVILVVGTLSASADFEAGIAAIDITPKPGLKSWGYGPSAPEMTGTLDPLHARALVLRVPEKTLALVTLDLGRVPLTDSCERIRDRVKPIGVDEVIFTASHTHQAPPMDVDAPHTRKIEEKIGDAIEKAMKTVQPATIGVGRTTIDIAFNRRKILEDGQCMMVWRNAEQVPLGPVDHEAGIIKIADAAGKPIAVLVNYACHPVVLSWDNTKYSADYAGEMARVVKEESGAECLFLQGGSGDINPYLDKTPVSEGGIEAMRNVGRTAGYAVLAALEGIEAKKPANPSIATVSKRVTVGSRWDVSKPEAQAVLKAAYGEAGFNKYLAKLTPEFSVPVTVALLNGDLALACVPGEFFVQYQLDLKNLSPVKNTFMVGYANEFHVYFPTIKDSVARGYGAAMNTYVGAGAGDRVLTESLLEIGRLMGKLSLDPVREDFVLHEGNARETAPASTED